MSDVRKQSHELAAESRAGEAAALNRKDVKVVIAGREYTFLEPSRRQNRVMFGDVARVQQMAMIPNNNTAVMFEMLNCLIDWHPAIAADEAKIDDLLHSSKETFESVMKEAIAAYKEVALLVVPPFQKMAQAQETETDISNPTSTNA